MAGFSLALAAETGAPLKSTFKTVSAEDFKAHCLALLEEVAQTRLPLIVTKRGEAIARLIPMSNEVSTDLLGSVRYASEEDLLSPTGETQTA